MHNSEAPISFASLLRVEQKWEHLNALVGVNNFNRWLHGEYFDIGTLFVEALEFLNGLLESSDVKTKGLSSCLCYFEWNVGDFN